MGIRYVISDPEPVNLSWWQRHKALTCLGLGLAGGLWMHGCHADPAPVTKPPVATSSASAHTTAPTATATRSAR
jgi:hypothetical protein